MKKYFVVIPANDFYNIFGSSDNLVDAYKFKEIAERLLSVECFIVRLVEEEQYE